MSQYRITSACFRTGFPLRSKPAANAGVRFTPQNQGRLMVESNEWNETKEPPVEEGNDKRWIAGFWSRIFALFLDSLLLGAIGFGLGLAFESEFVEMGALGRTIGFAVALTYFGLMNSVIGKGQTLGKRILDIRVVDASGSYISLSKSFARYIIFAIPFLFNGADITSNAHLSYLIYPLSIIVFGGLFSIVYLYLFNRRTRQSLHDLVVGSYVVNSASSVENVNSIWKVHLVISAATFVLAVILPIFTIGFADSHPFNELLSTQKALSGVPEVRLASVKSGKTIFSSTESGTQTSTYITVQVYVKEQLIDDQEFAKELAEIVAKNFPDYQSKNVVQVILTYGFDIGIWSQWSNHNHTFKPEELGQAASQNLTKTGS